MGIPRIAKNAKKWSVERDRPPAQTIHEWLRQTESRVLIKQPAADVRSCSLLASIFFAPGIFLPGPRLLVAPCLKVGLGAGRQEGFPCAFERIAGLLERLGVTAAVSARFGARVEAQDHFQLSTALGVPAALAMMPTRTSPK